MTAKLAEADAARSMFTAEGKENFRRRMIALANSIIATGQAPTMGSLAADLGVTTPTIGRHVRAIRSRPAAYPDWPIGLDFKPGCPQGVRRDEESGRAVSTDMTFVSRREFREIIERLAEKWAEGERGME